MELKRGRLIDHLHLRTRDLAVHHGGADRSTDAVTITWNGSS